MKAVCCDDNQDRMHADIPDSKADYLSMESIELVPSAANWAASGQPLVHIILLRVKHINTLNSIPRSTRRNEQK